MSKYSSTNPKISFISKRSVYESYDCDPQPMHSSQALQQTEDFPIQNSFQNGKILPTKYAKVEYRPPQKTYKVLETITKETIIRDPIMRPAIEEPVKYLEPIYKNTVIDSDPKDMIVIKNKTIVLNAGEKIPDLEEIELMPSVIAKNSDEGHKILHNAGLTESTMPKVDKSKYQKKSTIESKISTHKNDNNKNENNKNFGNDVKFEMGVGDPISASSYKKSNSKNNNVEDFMTSSKSKTKVRKLESSEHTSKKEGDSIYMSQPQPQPQGGISMHMHKSKKNGFNKKINNSQQLVIPTNNNKQGDYQAIYMTQPLPIEIKSSVPKPKKIEDSSIYISQPQPMGFNSVHMSKQEVKPSVHISQQQQPIDLNSVHMSKQEVKPSAHISQHQQSIGLNSVHISKQEVNPSAYMSQPVNPTVPVSQPLNTTSIHMSKQQPNEIKSTVKISQTSVGPSIHISQTQSIGGKSIHMSNQVINPSVNMSKQLNPSINIGQGVQYPSYNISNDNNQNNNRLGDYTTSVHNSRQVVGPTINSSSIEKEKDSPVVSAEIGSVINQGMTSFPVGPSGNDPTCTLVPNPFENPFSTIKGNRPSDPMNFPNPFKNNDSDNHPGLKKSTGDLFK